MSRILITKTVEGYDHEVEEETNSFLLKLKERNLEFKTLVIGHGPGQRIVQAIVVAADEEQSS